MDSFDRDSVASLFFPSNFVLVEFLRNNQLKLIPTQSHLTQPKPLLKILPPLVQINKNEWLKKSVLNFFSAPYTSFYKREKLFFAFIKES